MPMLQSPTNSLSSLPRAALVTGGAQRIGRAIALALAKHGFAVALQARRSRAAAEQVCGEIAAAGGRAAVVTADLGDHAAVLRLVPDAAAAVGPLTLLVNNAAEFEPDQIGSLDRDRFDRHVAVNLRAPVFLAEAFAAQLPAGADGAVINLLDQRVINPTPRFLSYGLAKSALYAGTTTLAQALAPRIRVNAVAPGPTLPSARQDAAAFARQVQALPLDHGPSAQDIADAVLYLANARSVTGVTIAVDGGQHLAWRTTDGAEVEE
jgi:NAD(P)-dependent dehydrogenase (short-subunit alcohol dehydrogenase family)